MSVNSIFNIATSGLFASQSGIKTVSQNIANVNTKGYVRVEQNQSAVNLAGTNAGVQVDALRRAANRFLQNASITASGNFSNYEVRSQYLENVQSLFGDPTSSSSLFSKINSALGSFETAMSNPGSVSVRRDILSQMQSLLTQISNTSTQIQVLRTQVDHEIESTVDEINSILDDIAKMNSEITKSNVQGDSTGAQERQSQLLDKLSSYIDIRVDFTQDGIAKVYTKDGTFLTGYEASELSYDSPATGQTYFNTIGIGFAGSTSNVELEKSIQSGKLRGLLDIRNQDLHDILEYVGEFAGKLTDSINSIHNLSSSLPALQNVAGADTGLLASDALNFTGNTTIGIVASDGSLQRKIDVNFTAGTLSVNGGAATPIGATVGSFVAALNTAMGASGNANFANGVLSINSTTAGNGIVFDEPTTNGSLRGDKAFAHFFGLNNLISSSQQTGYVTGLSPTDAHGFTVGDTFSMRLVSPSGAIVTDKTFTIPAGNFQDVLNTMNNGATGFGIYGAFTLDTQGSLKFNPNVGNESLKFELTKDTSPRGSTQLAFGQLMGLSQSSRISRGTSMKINSNIMADPRKLGLAMPDLASVAIGSVGVGLGDSSGAEAMFDVVNNKLNFYTGLGLNSKTMTLGEFVASIAGDLGTRSANAEADMNGAQSVKTEADDRRSNIEGVNLDEELVKLTAFQQAYSASARMIKAADEMYETLLNAV